MKSAMIFLAPRLLGANCGQAVCLTKSPLMLSSALAIVQHFFGRHLADHFLGRAVDDL
jgi:hypothetical protein